MIAMGFLSLPSVCEKETDQLSPRPRHTEANNLDIPSVLKKETDQPWDPTLHELTTDLDLSGSYGVLYRSLGSYR